MSWIDDAVADFGRNLGIPDFALSDRGVVNLIYESSGSLYLEKVDAGLMVYLTREMERMELKLLQDALELCHWERANRFPLNAAIFGEKHLVFSTILKEEDVSVPTLQATIEFLKDSHEHVQAGG